MLWQHCKYHHTVILVHGLVSNHNQQQQQQLYSTASLPFNTIYGVTDTNYYTVINKKRLHVQQWDLY